MRLWSELKYAGLEAKKTGKNDEQMHEVARVAQSRKRASDYESVYISPTTIHLSGQRDQFASAVPRNASYKQKDSAASRSTYSRKEHKLLSQELR